MGRPSGNQVQHAEEQDSDAAKDGWFIRPWKEISKNQNIENEGEKK